MREPIGELYLKWLYRQVANWRVRDPNNTYWALFRQLHSKEFTWFVPNDDNRVEDGKYLRYSFLREIHQAPEFDPEWLNLKCSMLEMLVALSKRLSFFGGGASSACFWEMISNLDIYFSDQGFNQNQQRRINRAINRVINRTYEPDGRGGLFPVSEPPQDQRRVEIWYQMNHYLIERG